MAETKSTYSKGAYAESLGITRGELEKRAKDAGFSTTEDYYNSQTGGGSSTGLSNDFGKTVQQALTLSRQAVQPAISTLEQGKEPLKERYDQLINEIKGYEKQAVDRETLAQSRELGKRGILNSSGLYDQTINQAINPITQNYAGLVNEAGRSQESQIQAINQAIANLQAGAGTNSISTALNLLGLNQSQDQFTKQLSQQASQFDKSYGLSKQQTEYNVNAPYFKPDSGGTDLSSLFSLLFPQSTGSQSTQLGQTPQYTPAYDGVIDGNFISQGGTWIPRYEVVY